MPALVNSSVGSPCGTSELLRTRRWPLDSKNLRKVSRTSLPDQNFALVVSTVTVASEVCQKISLWQTQKGSGERAGSRKDGREDCARGARGEMPEAGSRRAPWCRVP